METLPAEEEWRSHQEMRGQALTAVLHWGTPGQQNPPQTRPSSTTAHPALPSSLIQHPSPPGRPPVPTPSAPVAGWQRPGDEGSADSTPSQGDRRGDKWPQAEQLE